MTKRPYSLAIYSDIQAVLDTVLRHNEPGRLVLDSSKRATIWCQRANKFRVAMRQQDEQLHGLPAGAGTSPYDQLVFRKRENDVLIEFRQTEGTLEIRGTAIEPESEDFGEFQIPDED